MPSLGRRLLPLEKAEAANSRPRGWPCTGAGLLLKHCFLCCRSVCVKLASGFLCQGVRGRKFAITISGALRMLSKLLSVCFLSTLYQLCTFNYKHLKDPWILLMNLKDTWVDTTQHRYLSETLVDWHTNPSTRNCVSVSQDFCDSPESNCAPVDRWGHRGIRAVPDKEFSCNSKTMVWSLPQAVWTACFTCTVKMLGLYDSPLPLINPTSTVTDGEKQMPVGESPGQAQCCPLDRAGTTPLFPTRRVWVWWHPGGWQALHALLPATEAAAQQHGLRRDVGRATEPLRLPWRSPPPARLLLSHCRRHTALRELHCPFMVEKWIACPAVELRDDRTESCHLLWFWQQASVLLSATPGWTVHAWHSAREKQSPSHTAPQWEPSLHSDTLTEK